MRYGFLNNFRQALAAELAAGATTMTLDGGGDRLADASTDYRYKLTLIQRDAFGNETHREIVEVTGASGNDLTVDRQQEGTAQLSPWPNGTRVEARVTAGQLLSLQPEPSIRQELIALGPVDFSDAQSNASHTMATGRVLYVDSVEVVPVEDSASRYSLVDGTPELAGNGRRVAINNAGTWLAAGTGSPPYLYVRSTSDWVSPSLPGFSDYVLALAFSHDGSLLAVGGGFSTPFLEIIDTSSWAVVQTLPPSGTVFDVAFSDDDAYLASAHNNGGGLTVHSTSDWSAVTVPTTGGDGFAVAWNADSTQLAAGGAGGLLIVNPSDWSAIGGTPSIDGWVNAVDYDSGGRLAVGDDENDLAMVFDSSDWSTLATLAIPGDAGWVSGVRWDPQTGGLAVSHNGTGGLVVFDPVEWMALAAPTSWQTINALAYSGDGALFAHVGDAAPHLSVFNVSDVTIPGIDLGESEAAAGSLLAAQPLSSFVAGNRQPLAVGHPSGISSLYVAPSPPGSGGGGAVVVVRGYSMES